MSAGDAIIEPDWLLRARREIGVKERRKGDHPRIVQYLKATRIAPAMHEDETPWCAAFVSWVLEQSGIASTRSAAARSYLHWGQELTEPRQGCVVVLTRLDSPSHGHVGFYVGGTPEDVLLLGGNQNNAVSQRLYPRERVLSYRWPASP